MKILYGIQGTGNGHISRAGAILPELCKHATVHTLISGSSNEFAGGFPTDYRVSGLGFSFGKNGGIDYRDSLAKARPAELLQDVQNLPVEQYDLIISDFEPVSAWAGKLKNIPVLALSHQAAFLSEKSPRPVVRQFWGEILFRNYAPANSYFGFHFEAYDQQVFTPIIRQDVRALSPAEGEHITIYLPAYSPEKLMPCLKQLERPVHLFTKHQNHHSTEKNVQVIPVDGELYLSSLESCKAVVCGAGFESPSEALYLGKRLICIPMSGQYEQQCNAAALRMKGVSVLSSAYDHLHEHLNELLKQPAPAPVAYPDIIPDVVQQVLEYAENPTGETQRKGLRA